MRYYLILNPGSRSGTSKKRFEKIFKALDSREINYDFRITSKLEDARTFSAWANSEGYNRIIAVGGDGTINNAINGFYDNEGKRISNSSFGVIYTGTSPDFCKSYNIPLKLNDAIGTILNPDLLAIRLGKIILNQDNEQNATRFFACCVNIGLGAELARRSNSGARKYLGDFFGTFSSLLVTIAGFKPPDLVCNYGGLEKSIKKCFNLSIGITPLIASGIKVPIEPGHDKQFYIMSACDLGISNVFGVIKKVYSGKPFKNESSLWIEYAEKVEILSKNSEVEFDGDPQGFSPCNISFASDDLNILVPEKGQ